MPSRPVKDIARNKRARFDYNIEQTLEAGLSLVGSEVKTLRAGRASIVEAFIEFDAERGGSAWLVHANIPKFAQAGPQNHEPDRRRRLLMSRRELDSWSRRAHEKGFSVIPLRLYFRGPWVKLEIGLGKGQKRYDKREKIREKTDRRETQRALRERR